MVKITQREFRKGYHSSELTEQCPWWDVFPALPAQGLFFPKPWSLPRAGCCPGQVSGASARRGAWGHVPSHPSACQGSAPWSTSYCSGAFESLSGILVKQNSCVHCVGNQKPTFQRSLQRLC